MSEIEDEICSIFAASNLLAIFRFLSSVSIKQHKLLELEFTGLENSTSVQKPGTVINKVTED